MSREDEPRHFIAYVRWDVVLEWKAAEAKAGRISGRQRKRPYAYGTAKSTLHNNARKDDILWIITLPKFGAHVAAPSLLARLHIEEKIDQSEGVKSRRRVPLFIRNMWDPDPKVRMTKKKNWQYVVLASRAESGYFPVNDANDRVKNLRFKGCPDRLPEELEARMYSTLGMHMQNIRELKPESGRALRRYADLLGGRRNVFISYRRKEGAKTVKDLVSALNKKKFNCWVDEQMLPGKIAKGIVRISDPKLKASIRNAIRQSNFFVAVKGKRYLESKWTRFEWKVAGDREKAQGRVRGERFKCLGLELSHVRKRGVASTARGIVRMF